MRIFVAVRHSIDPRYFYGNLWSSNFYSALQRLGHEIIESKVDLLPASKFMHIPHDFTSQEQEVRAQITHKLLEEVKQAHLKQPINLFISYFYNAHFDPAGFDDIHRLGIPTVNFYCNSIYQFNLVAEIAAKVNISWHAEKHARPLYLKVGANPVWVQMGADPYIYHPVSGSLREKRACFIGQQYADRAWWIGSLLLRGIPVDIYGGGWPSKKSTLNLIADSSKSPNSETLNNSMYLGRKICSPGSLQSYSSLIYNTFKEEGLFRGIGRISRQLFYRYQSRQFDALLAQAYQGYADSLSQTFAQYEIILNCSNVWSDGKPGSVLIPHVRLRDFEAPMSRVCYLTGHTDEIADFYEIGKEIDTYKTVEELVDKSKFYLAKPEQAEKLRESGYRRARRDHTWENRFQELFKSIDISS